MTSPGTRYGVRCYLKNGRRRFFIVEGHWSTRRGYFQSKYLFGGKHHFTYNDISNMGSFLPKLS